MLHLPLDLPPFPSADAELTNLVRWWDEEFALAGRRPSDKEMALKALLSGWWPERMTKPHATTTVADVVDMTRRAVKQVRTGK
jgi:hypothetical protein